MAVDHHHASETPHVHQDGVQPLLKSGILAGLGLYFTYNLVSGNLSNYINVRFTWLSYLATALFFLLALAQLHQWVGGRNRVQHHGETEAENLHSHSHDRTSWWILGIAALPLILGILIPSQPLGAEAVGGDIRISAFTIQETTSFTSNPLDRNVLDWLRQFNSSTDLSIFNGQEASVIGFIYREPDFPKAHFMVSRFVVSCCVADSSAIGLPVFANDHAADDIEDGTWVRVEGTFQVGIFQEYTLPILQLAAIEIVDQPAHPYLYP
jgi:uncharacterized repeat protein (TIGR03943 family)